MLRWITHSPEETETAAAELIPHLAVGRTFLLEGNLGAGKTTFVRGLVRALGWTGPVRSPSFSLIQLYELNPPILHADLYRLGSTRGIGLEDYLDDHVLFVEWPKADDPLWHGRDLWTVEFQVDGEARIIEARPMQGPESA